jgi:hypothetical protein
MCGLFTVTEWKERLATDTGVAAVELVDVELAVALEAAKEAGWADKVRGEPRICAAEHLHQRSGIALLLILVVVLHTKARK